MPHAGLVTLLCQTKHMPAPNRRTDVVFAEPKEWARKKYPGPDCVENGKLTDLPAEDKKYLRVHFKVQEGLAREKFRFGETQVDVLREIARRLRRKS
jgi:hypothetical protein